MAFYDCVDRNMAGEEVKMSEFAGNVLLLGKKVENLGIESFSLVDLSLPSWHVALQ